MALVEIPVFPEQGAFEAKVQLDGYPFTFRGHWNGRMGRWVLDIMDEEGVEVVSAVPVVTDWMLTDPFKGRVSGFWYGDLIAVDTTKQGKQATLENFGKDVKLFYQEA